MKLKSGKGKHLYCLLLFLILSTSALSQKRNNIWCFGDSAGINFNNFTNPLPILSSVRSRGSCVSISDSTGSLNCYAATTELFSPADTFQTKVYNRYHQLIQNGDSIVGLGWYYELVLLPYPGTNNLYYLFSIGVTDNYGLYYSVIDMNQNGGSGAVTQKNVQLLNYRCSDGLTAIKHANGRDWWVLFRRGYLPTNEFYIYLVTPAGIQGPAITALGSLSNSGFLRQVFSPDGSKLMIINAAGLIELYEFDRCTGLPSNPMTIEQENLNNPPYYFSGEFSKDAHRFYFTDSYLDTSRLMQIDLLASNITASKDTIYEFTYPPCYNAEGVVKRGPDGKIYVANCYYNGIQHAYPYADSMYNMYNMYISVINSPDSLGAACDFQPYSFYLGGKRSYWGLPNNPDYDLGPVVGSICDSLHTSVENLLSAKAELKIYYHSSWEVAYINAQQLKGRTYLLSVFDVSGKRIFSESGKLNSPYYTKSLNCQGFAAGVYLVTLETEQEKMTERFVRD